MKTIDNKTKEIERWKEAQKSLEEVNKMMKLVKQYPTKIIKTPTPCGPYESALKNF